MTDTGDIVWAVLIIAMIVALPVVAIIKSGNRVPDPDRGIGCWWAIAAFLVMMALVSCSWWKDAIPFLTIAPVWRLVW